MEKKFEFLHLFGYNIYIKKGKIIMRTTLDIEAKLLEDVVKTTKAPSKKKAIETALKEFLRARHRKELSELIGNYEEFALTLEELERMRSES